VGSGSICRSRICWNIPPSSLRIGTSAVVLPGGNEDADADEWQESVHVVHVANRKRKCRRRSR